MKRYDELKLGSEKGMSKIPFCCPCQEKSKLKKIENGFVCEHSECVHSMDDNCFPTIKNVPILISEEKCDTVFSAGSVKSVVSRPMSKLGFLKKIIVGESATTKKNCARFVQELKKMTDRPRVLIIGSGEKGAGTDTLWEDKDIERHGVDIYVSDSVDAVCDAHYLPFESNSYDGIWIQAVLEHVVEPNSVVSEIYRVLNVNGVVYAETPFMQQVHEGAYDFTRYTVLGHRYLFKKFHAIEFGGNKGPEIVLAWAFRYFVWSITRSRKLARILGLAFGILMRPFAYLVSAKSMHDASSGVFFLGLKRIDHDLSHKELVSLYRGQF